MNNILSFTKGYLLIISEIQANKKSERTFEIPCMYGIYAVPHLCLQNISKTGRGTPTNDILVTLKVAEHGFGSL